MLLSLSSSSLKALIMNPVGEGRKENPVINALADLVPLVIMSRDCTEENRRRYELSSNQINQVNHQSPSLKLAPIILIKIW